MASIQSNAHEQNFIQFTALWAFTETTLGGLMHALHLPFTGIFVGGFAVMLLILMAHQFSYAEILKSTFLVVFVKLMASPQSPPAAYLAVGFQGFAAAFFFSIIPIKQIATYLFAVIAMLESAIQKILVMTLINGKAFWEALDAFGNSVSKDFGLAQLEQISLSWSLMLFYVALYFVWGFILGFWGLRLLNKSKTRKIELSEIKNQYKDLIVQKQTPLNKKITFWGLLIYLVFISLLWITGYSSSKLLYLTIRSFIGLLVLVYGLNPLLNYLVKRWIRQKNATAMPYLNSLMELQPQFNQNWEIAKLHIQQLPKQRLKKIKQIELFILLSIGS